jgi:drug/metabolite transporter (DMT)-like permease
MNKFLLAIPALTDVTMTVLNYIALNFVSGSIYQMLRGGSVATTLLFSIFLLKIKVTRYQIGGTVLTLIGIAVVGISHYFFEKKSHNKL